jgi:hypothetical protein
MLIDFQSKFNNFNDVRFSDQVSGCDFEFSSVLRRWWWKGWGKNGEDMEGEWSVQQITLYWTSANIYHHRRSLFSPLFSWHSEVLNWISYKLLTNFELAPISISFAPLFHFYYFPSVIFVDKKLFATNWRGFLFCLYFLTRLDTVRLNFVMTCFLFI